MIIVCWAVKVFYAYVFFLRPPASLKKETIIALISPEGNVVALNKFFDADVDVSYLERKALWYERTHNIFGQSNHLQVLRLMNNCIVTPIIQLFLDIFKTIIC